MATTTSEGSGWRAATSPFRDRRTWRRLAGVILSAEGLLGLAFGLGNGLPPLWLGWSATEILAGIGVYRGVDAATAIAVVLAGLLIISDVTSLPAAFGGGASMSLPGIAVELLANVVVVYALLRRPPRGSVGPT